MPDTKPKKKYLDKFDTDEEVVAAYAELEKKLGEQGTKMGTLQKQIEETQKSLGQYADYVKAVKPIADWYTTNEKDVTTWWQTRGKGNGDGAGAADEAARRAAAGTEGYQWLTPQEKQALVQEIKASLLDPFQQQFTSQAQDFAKKLSEALSRQHGSFTDVMWRTLERFMPADKIGDVRQWHEKALEFADPSKVDPMKVAGEWMSLSSDNARMKTEFEALQKKVAEMEKAAVPSLGSGPSPSLIQRPEDAPKTREDRFARVMDSVKSEHGTEGVAALFPGGGR
mgnify:CR=1 FL=1